MHTSVAKARPFNHEQSRVNELVPQYVIPPELRNRADGLIKFLEEYYKYLNQEGMPTYQLTELVSQQDINQTSMTYLDSIQAEIASIIPESEVMDRVTLYKRIVHFYRAKGTPGAVEAFFRIFFTDSDFELVIDSVNPWTYSINTNRPTNEWYYSFRNLVHPVGLKFIAIYNLLIEAGFISDPNNDERVREAFVALFRPILIQANFLNTSSKMGCVYRSGDGSVRPSTLELHYPLTSDYVINTRDESDGAVLPASWYEPDDNSDDTYGSDISDFSSRAATYFNGGQAQVDAVLNPAQYPYTYIVQDISGNNRHALLAMFSTSSSETRPTTTGTYFAGLDATDSNYQTGHDFIMPVPLYDYITTSDSDRIRSHDFGIPWSFDNADDWTIAFWIKTDELRPENPEYHDNKSMYYGVLGDDTDGDSNDAPWLGDSRVIVGGFGSSNEFSLDGGHINGSYIGLTDGGVISYIFTPEHPGVAIDTKEIQSKSRVNDNKWHHVTVTNNGAMSEIKIYIDGRLETIGWNDLQNPDSSEEAGPYYFLVNSLMRGFPWQDYDESTYDPGLQQYPSACRGYLRDYRVYSSELTASDIFRLARKTYDQVACDILKLIRNPDISNFRNSRHMSDFLGWGKFWDSTRIGNYGSVRIIDANQEYNTNHPMAYHNASSNIVLKNIDSDESSAAFDSDDYTFTFLDEESDSESEGWF